MERPTCRTCPYWEADELDPAEPGWGSCRRYPPVLPSLPSQAENSIRCFGEDYADRGHIPGTWSFEWCGEHPDFPAYIRSLKGPTIPSAGIGDAANIYYFRALSIRASKAVRRAGIETAEQLAEMTKDDLLALKGFGHSCLNEARGVLARCGLRLKDE